MISIDESYVVGSEAILSLYPILIKAIPTSLPTQIFSRLILDKENVIVTEFNKTQLSIYNKINYVNHINLVEFYCWSLVIGLIVLYGLYLLINYILI